MAKYHEPKPLSERASNNVGVGNYVKAMFPGITAAIAGGVFHRMKLKELPGSAKARTLNTLSLLSFAISPFLVWRKNEAMNVGIHELYDQYKEVRKSRMDNNQLREDNDHLKKMIAYEERELAGPAQDILAKGKRSPLEHALSQESTEISR